MKTSKTTRIVIPTTRAPSDILRLAREDARIGRSTVCLGGSTRQAGIDADYNAFVREPTGVIEKFHGHAAFRLDISEPIDAGLSWQLAAFLAHALEVEGSLYSALDAPESLPARTVWATGAVDTVGLRLSPVGHIEVKARQVLASESADMFLMPSENAADLPPLLRDAMQARGIAVHTPRTAAEALNLLGIEPGWLASASNAQSGVGGERVSWTGMPYRGLEYYDEEHRSIFFGRARAREEAVERLRRNAARGTGLLVVHGTSGVGKSSLVLAGLKGDTVEQAQEGAPWVTATIRFGGSAAPEPALWSAIAGAADGVDDPGPDPVARLAALLDAAGKSHLLLILDQFEQALSCPQAELDALAATLVALARSDRAWLVATLRTDRMELLERAPVLARIAEGDALYRLAPPTLSELGQIIRAPAALASYRFETAADEDDLADRLAQIALGAPDSLPLLQIVLMRLAEHAGTDRLITVAAYERIGGFEGAVGRWAEDTVTALIEAGTDPVVIDLCLASLVRVDENLGRTDARVIGSATLPSAQRTVIDAFVAARLVSLGQGGNVRLVHETLIRDWPRLSELVIRLRDDLALRDRIEKAADLWHADGRPAPDLIRTPTRLDAVQALAENAVVPLSPLAGAFVAASLEARDHAATMAQTAARTRLRRARLTATVAIAAMSVMAVLGLWALDQRHAAREQTALARQNEVSARNAQTQADAVAGEFRRSRDQEAIIGTDRLVRDGQVDLALLKLLAASESLLDIPVSDAVPIAFEKALERAAFQTTHLVPADATGFDYRYVLFFNSPSQEALWRFDGSDAPERIGDLKGKAIGIFDLLPDVGPVLVVEGSDRIEFYQFDPQTGAGALLLALPGKTPLASGWEIDMGPDGVLLAVEKLPEEVMRRSDAPDPASYLGRLDTGRSTPFDRSQGAWLATESGGRSVIHTNSPSAQQAAARLGVATETERADLETTYTRCLGADAVSARARHYETAIRHTAHDSSAFRIDCHIAGDHVAMSLIRSGSAGLWNTLHLVDIRDLDAKEGEAEDTEIEKSRHITDGFSLADGVGAEGDRRPPDLFHYSFRDVTMQSGYEDIQTLRMASPVETIVALGEGRAAAMIAPEQAQSATKSLVLLDFRAGQTYGQTVLGRSTEPMDPSEAENSIWESPGTDRRCLGLPVSVDASPSEPVAQHRSPYAGMIKIMFRGDSFPLTVSEAMVKDRLCVRLAPSGKHYAVWYDGALRIFSVHDGREIGQRPMQRPPRDFTFVRGETDLMITEGNSVIRWWAPSYDPNSQNYSWVSHIQFRSADPVVGLSMSPDGDRMIYQTAIGGGVIRSQVYSLVSNEIWRTLGEAHKFYEARFLDNETIFFWDGRQNMLHHLPDLAQSRDLARAALSNHCALDGKKYDASPCLKEISGTVPPL